MCIDDEKKHLEDKKNEQIFASKYKTVLPSESVLKKRIENR